MSGSTNRDRKDHGGVPRADYRAIVNVTAVLLALGGVGACKPTAPSAPDARVSATTPDASPRGRTRRRRRRGAARLARAARAGEPGTTSGTDDTLGIPDDEPAARVRPRITESGPMLPEELGSPSAVSYDMTQAGGAGTPSGLEPGEISQGFSPLLGRLSVCADATSDDQGHGPHGRISVRVRIRQDGRPVAARVSSGGGSAEFVTCVRRVVASARFARFSGPDVFATWGFDVD